MKKGEVCMNAQDSEAISTNEAKNNTHVYNVVHRLQTGPKRMKINKGNALTRTTQNTRPQFELPPAKPVHIKTPTHNWHLKQSHATPQVLADLAKKRICKYQS